MTLTPEMMSLVLGRRRGRNTALVPPIGATPLVLWDVRSGILQLSTGVTRWTDIIRGLPLNDNGSTTRPAFGPDYNYFGGLPVLQFDGVNDVLLNAAISPAITAVGTRPHWFCVFRFRGANGSVFVVTETGASFVPYVIRAASVMQARGNGTILNGTDPFGAQRVSEYFMTAAAGVSTLGLDGVDVTSGSGLAMDSAAPKLYVGNNNNLNLPGAVSIAAIGCYAAELTGPQRVALRDYYATAFPAPPPNPSDFLSNLLVWIDPAYSNVSLGKIASFTNRGNLGGLQAQGVGANRATLNAADASFNNKPTIAVAPPSFYYLNGFGNPASAECFIVCKNTGEATLQRTGPGAGGQSGYVPTGSHDVYGEFCTDVRKTCGNPVGVDFTLPTLIDMWSAPSDWGIRFNRSTFYSIATNNCQVAGAGFVMRDNRDADSYCTGSWAAYLLCGAKQSPAQRAQMEAWVLATYGV